MDTVTKAKKDQVTMICEGLDKFVAEAKEESMSNAVLTTLDACYQHQKTEIKHQNCTQNN